jgi:hypothetical protein
MPSALLWQPGPEAAQQLFRRQRRRGHRRGVGAQLAGDNVVRDGVVLFEEELGPER